MIKRIATLVVLALVTASTRVDVVPVSGPAGTYTVKTTGPTRITSGAGWIMFDWDVDAVIPPVAPVPAPTPVPSPVPLPTPVPVHNGHFTLSYIEPIYTSPVSATIRNDLAKVNWKSLDATYRAYVEKQSQLDSLGFTKLFKSSDLPIVFLQETTSLGSPVIDKLKSPTSSDAVVSWVKGFRGQ